MLEIVLHHFSIADPWLSLALTLIFISGWSVQIALWGICDIAEYHGVGGIGWCSSWPSLVRVDYGGLGEFGLMESSPLQLARFFTAMLTLGICIVLMGMACAACDRERRHGTEARKNRKAIESWKSSRIAHERTVSDGYYPKGSEESRSTVHERTLSAGGVLGGNAPLPLKVHDSYAGEKETVPWRDTKVGDW
jgi:hypothetical protein